MFTGHIEQTAVGSNQKFDFQRSNYRTIFDQQILLSDDLIQVNHTSVLLLLSVLWGTANPGASVVRLASLDAK